VSKNSSSEMKAGRTSPCVRSGFRAAGALLRALSLSLPLLVGTGTALGQDPRSIESQPLHIVLGKSVVLNLESRLKRVLVSNPDIIDVLATNPNQMIVEAKGAGTSSLILWDEAGVSRMLDVTVDVDVAGLRSAIDQAFPHSTIAAHADGDRLVLTGSVPNQHAEDDLVKMASTYSKEVVDSLDRSPAHQRQILLEVKIVEVDRTRMDQFGFNLLSTGAANTNGVVSTQQYGPITGNGGPLALGGGVAPTYGISNLLNIFFFRQDINLGASIQALQQKSVLQILAEPNLVAMNGVKATFLAGGEFPFPVVQGGAAVGAVTIQFRPYGVKLDFTGTIADDNTIRLLVAPEVSSLDFTNALTISGFTVPAISTRRAETEVELKDGQSFGIGGLLDQTTTTLLSKIPGIGDVPVLGKLFQSKSIQKNNSEVIILVEPHIVDPVNAVVPAPSMAMPTPVVPFLDMKKYDQEFPGHGTGPTPPPPAAK
jgi:pilus assembly protein CpaC